MIYQATVVRVGDEVEEEVMLRVCDIELACFAGVCPYKIEVGLSYSVELHAMIFNEYSVTELPCETRPSVTRIGNGFGYVINGKLSGKLLESGALVFEDEVLQRDFGHLDGKSVALKVDRIDVEFL